MSSKCRGRSLSRGPSWFETVLFRLVFFFLLIAKTQQSPQAELADRPGHVQFPMLCPVENNGCKKGGWVDVLKALCVEGSRCVESSSWQVLSTD